MWVNECVSEEKICLRNNRNEFIFDFNQSIELIKKNLKNYLKLNYENDTGIC